MVDALEYDFEVFELLFRWQNDPAGINQVRIDEWQPQLLASFQLQEGFSRDPVYVLEVGCVHEENDADTRDQRDAREHERMVGIGVFVVVLITVAEAHPVLKKVTSGCALKALATYLRASAKDNSLCWPCFMRNSVAFSTQPDNSKDTRVFRITYICIS
uniref:Uncharacterized protein n=1 Tax=Rhipicephalus microplus TaxID=6941 RepID=A0A6G5AHP6_RHIMP